MLAQPNTYYQAVSLAKLHEQKMTTLQPYLKHVPSKAMGFSAPYKAMSYNSAYLQPQGKSNTSSVSVKTQSSTNNASVVPATSLTSGSINNNASNTPTYKRFTAAELRARRDKGLCYYCDEKYHQQHKCKTLCFLTGWPRGDR